MGTSSGLFPGHRAYTPWSCSVYCLPASVHVFVCLSVCRYMCAFLRLLLSVCLSDRLSVPLCVCVCFPLPAQWYMYKLTHESGWAGATSTVGLYPLETLRTRLAMGDYDNMLHAVKAVTAEEGFMAFYQVSGFNSPRCPCELHDLALFLAAITSRMS